MLSQPSSGLCASSVASAESARNARRGLANGQASRNESGAPKPETPPIFLENQSVTIDSDRLIDGHRHVHAHGAHGAFELLFHF